MPGDEGLQPIWGDLVAFLRTHHGGICRGWFDELRLAGLEGGEALVESSNQAQRTYLENHCRRSFADAVQAATGRLVSVRFTTRGDDGASQATNHRAVDADGPSLRLNSDYRFEHFVTGPCNQLAHASCVAVSEAPGLAYNPLFIHGNVGLGKTHLLHAICHSVFDRVPDAQITYLSCEEFINQFIEAIERGELNTFRYQYRHADVLVIDDIQFLGKRERTQEEFFHTFNTLYQSQKQIVLTADCSPSDIPGLEERLVSRFNWGLIARIDSPCLETRLAIVRKKAHLRGIQLPDDVAMLIATRIKANARELEGALTCIQGVASLHGGIIDRSVAEIALREGRPETPREIRIQDIINVVTEEFDVKLSDLQGRSRSRSIVFPRQVCMYLARQFTQHSLGEIGGFFGGRDHTTVLHAGKLVTRRRADESAVHARLERIEDLLRER